ncbi:hypothetical protein [Candidatus Uabimicrobium sp. HlEnr_7]|uniref:hypothetical protein n=1 Tax=Candidatus Uabimicrobium helgolandensis TaxID=3095367 RepID=UPI00355763C6
MRYLFLFTSVMVVFFNINKKYTCDECVLCLSTKSTEQWSIDTLTGYVAISPLVTHSFFLRAFNDYLKEKHTHQWFPKSRSSHYLLGASGCSNFPIKANDVLRMYERTTEFRDFVKKQLQQKKLTKTQICSVLVMRNSLCQQQLITDFWNSIE